MLKIILIACMLVALAPTVGAFAFNSTSTLTVQEPPPNYASSMKYNFFWSTPNYQDSVSATATEVCSDGVTSCATTVKAIYNAGYLSVDATGYGKGPPDGFMLTIQGLWPVSFVTIPADVINTANCWGKINYMTDAYIVTCTNASQDLSFQFFL